MREQEGEEDSADWPFPEKAEQWHAEMGRMGKCRRCWKWTVRQMDGMQALTGIGQIQAEGEVIGMKEEKRRRRSRMQEGTRQRMTKRMMRNMADGGGNGRRTKASELRRELQRGTKLLKTWRGPPQKEEDFSQIMSEHRWGDSTFLTKSAVSPTN
jgi:hypothetical protein